MYKRQIKWGFKEDPRIPKDERVDQMTRIKESGQAGVTKATVTLIWDNTDAGQSPHGYESHAQITVTRQIVLGGRSKYMINGTTAQLQRVMNLYHSVQLNVNNPHFLIMQGRITKVLNMKPHEILSMLEEAAGTRMYESKKEAALKTLDKKQTKVDEIDKLLEEDILPTIEKLRKERLAAQEYEEEIAAASATSTPVSRRSRSASSSGDSITQRLPQDPVGNISLTGFSIAELEKLRIQRDGEGSAREVVIEARERSAPG